MSHFHQKGFIMELFSLQVSHSGGEWKEQGSEADTEMPFYPVQRLQWPYGPTELRHSLWRDRRDTQGGICCGNSLRKPGGQMPEHVILQKGFLQIWNSQHPTTPWVIMFSRFSMINFDILCLFSVVLKLNSSSSWNLCPRPPKFGTQCLRQLHSVARCQTEVMFKTQLV